MAQNKYPSQLVYGLDIGTRSVVGTVGYKKGKKFVVVAIKSIEHDTRAMMDGQIHDIASVSQTIKQVTEYLQKKTGAVLDRVCIAAAGRVLRTIMVHTDIDFEEDKVIDEEDIYTLDSLAIECAYKQFLETQDSNMRFYCVGNSVVRYFLNDSAITHLKDHKARRIGVDMIATFLPDDVVDSLYTAVQMAGLEIASLTLEPIAAINLAIPNKFRLLNIALLDVGAGTSDISITKDGSVVAFGMIPTAGDKLTEAIANGCMVDFNTAEYIKRQCATNATVTYLDIMGNECTVTEDEINQMVASVMEQIVSLVADKIIELNGGKSVGAVFVVGGGGTFGGYTDMLADKLNIPRERVAIRGQQVMNDIEFRDKKVNVDSLLVTPIGIALSYYEETNNFIYVSFNDDKTKIYKSNNLTVMDVAMQTEFPAHGLFPQSGEALHYTFNGTKKMARGVVGEPATIKVNGVNANMTTPVKENDIIEVVASVPGQPAHIYLKDLIGKDEVLNITINGQKQDVPKPLLVNNELKSMDYLINNGDKIEAKDYYTLGQILDYEGITDSSKVTCRIDDKEASLEDRIYSGQSVTYKLPEGISVIVNGTAVNLAPKSSYVFVDIFESFEFDLKNPKGMIVTKCNGKDAQYMQPIYYGDIIEVYWKE